MKHLTGKRRRNVFKIACTSMLLLYASQALSYTCREAPVDLVFAKAENIVYGRIVETRLDDPAEGEGGCGHFVHTLRTELALKGDVTETLVFQKKRQCYHWESGTISSIGGYVPRQLTGLFGVVYWSEDLPRIGTCVAGTFTNDPGQDCHIDRYLEAAGFPPLAPETRSDCRAHQREPGGTGSSELATQLIDPLSEDQSQRELEQRYNTILRDLDFYRSEISRLEIVRSRRKSAVDRVKSAPEVEFPCPRRTIRELFREHDVVSFVEIKETRYRPSEANSSNEKILGWCGVLEHRFDVIQDYKGSGTTIPFITQVLMDCPGEDTGLLLAEADWQKAVTGYYALVASNRNEPVTWKGCFDSYVFEAPLCEIFELEQAVDPEAARPEHCDEPLSRHRTQLVNNHENWEAWLAAELEEREYRLKLWEQLMPGKRQKYRAKQAELLMELDSIRDALGIESETLAEDPDATIPYE